jgi:hypothetical protein
VDDATQLIENGSRAEERRIMSIWEDPDVGQILGVQDDQPGLLFEQLDDHDGPLVYAFVEVDLARDEDSPPDVFLKACARGVTAFESLSSAAPVGWKKFLLNQVGDNARLIFDLFSIKAEAAAFADWVTASIEANRWGPDGNRTPLGEQHSACMALAAQSGGGVRQNPATGTFEAPNGDAARALARLI